jgi:hypothetical protein
MPIAQVFILRGPEAMDPQLAPPFLHARHEPTGPALPARDKNKAASHRASKGCHWVYRPVQRHELGHQSLPQEHRALVLNKHSVPANRQRPRCMLV